MGGRLPQADGQRIGKETRGTMPSRGGGRGRYTELEGDLPACLLHSFGSSWGRIDAPKTVELQAALGIVEVALQRSAPSEPSGGGSCEDSVSQHCSVDFCLKFMSKNVTSMFSETHFATLLAELELLRWDVLFLQETWREERSELFETKQGHLFIGSGGTPAEKGFAILINLRWSGCFQCMHPISYRILSVFVCMCGMQLNLMSDTSRMEASQTN